MANGQQKPSLPSSIYDSHSPSTSSGGSSFRKRILLFIFIFALAWIYHLSPSTPKLNLSQTDQDLHSSDQPQAESTTTPSSSWPDWSHWRIPSASLWLHNAHSPIQELTKALHGATSGESTTWESPTRPLPLQASLADRLKSWRDAPLPEPAVWVQFNLQTCSDHRVGKNANVDLLKVCSQSSARNISSSTNKQKHQKNRSTSSIKQSMH